MPVSNSSPRGSVIATRSGTVPPQSPSKAARQAAVAQAPVVQPRRSGVGREGNSAMAPSDTRLAARPMAPNGRFPWPGREAIEGAWPRPCPSPIETGPCLEPGWVWLCGAGPGDPGLLTLHALNALRQADVVVYDALVHEGLLDWAPQAEHIHAGKRGGKPSAVQRDISLRLVELARAGKRVLRLKGGDPFVFGRGGEEAQTLVQHGIPIRIVPGITAGIAGPAYAGIPVTHRDVNQSVTFVTGHDRAGAAPTALDWDGIARGSQVIVIYMGMKHLGEIASRLIAAGRSPSEPVAVTTSATLDEQRTIETTLATCATDVAAAGLEPPAIICVGLAVALRQALDWQAQAAGELPRDTDPLGLGRPAEAG